MGNCTSPIKQAKFDELDSFIASLPKTDSGQKHLIQVLHRAQEIFGYLPNEIQMHISKKLGITHADVYGVVSFYSYFTMVPRGKYQISVCTGTACYVKGAQSILETLEDELSVKSGETTHDGRFSLDILRCIGACGIAPVMTINGKAYGSLTNDQARSILKKYSQEES